MKRLVKYLSILLALFALLSVALALAAGWLLDSRTDALLRRAAAAFPGLELKNVYSEQGLFSKRGRIYINYTLPEGLSSGKTLQTAFDYRIRMGIMEIEAEFERAQGFGNLERLAGEYIGKIPEIRGHLGASLFKLGGSAEISSDPVTIPLSDGRCTLGAVTGQAGLDVTLRPSLTLALSSLECQGSELYQSRSAYYVKLADLTFAAKPTLSGRSLEALELELSADELSGEASTLYLIGFGPHDEVKDPSLREGAALKNPALSLRFGRRNSQGFGALLMEASGDLAFGLPYMKDGQLLPMQRIENIVLKAAIPSLNPDALKRELTREQPRLDAVFSKRGALKLEELSLKSGGEGLRLSGSAEAALSDDIRMRDLTLDFKGSAGKSLVESVIGDSYAGQLSSLVQSGAVSLTGGSYATALRFENAHLTLNGRSLELNSPNDAEAQETGATE